MNAAHDPAHDRARDPTRVTRHYATISHGRFGARQVHYRRAGAGPCLLMFHQSPLSSSDLLPAISGFQDRYTCIAPDTPGYGMSDPFGVDEVSMEDIADAAVEFMDAIGIEKCAVYGFHTGAMIAGAVAAHHPERVACAVANGYVVLTEAERKDFVTHYLPKFEPSWDGSHLTWLWARMREQTIFFPWYAKSLGARMNLDVPSPEALQKGVLEFLRAGDNYRVGYRAAFTFRSDQALRRVQVPLLVTAAETDPLHAQLPRIVRPATRVEVRPGGTVAQTLDLCRAFIDRHAVPPAPPVAATHPLRGRMWNQMVDVPGGQLRVRRNTDAAGRTVVVQHDAASSSDTVDAVSQSLVGRRPVLAIDLPGHGESDNTLAGPDGLGEVTVARYTQVVRQALDALALAEVDFYGMWGGGLVGLELAKQAPGRVHRLVMSDVLWLDEALLCEMRANYTPAVEVDWYGGHLLECWYLMRDQGLFFPWYERTKKGILWREPYVDPQMVHGRVVNVLKAPEMWRLAYQAHFAYPTQAELRAVKVPTLLCAPDWDPNQPHTIEASRATGLPYTALPDEMHKWGAAFLGFLDAR
jgi:pimeloyl-ACP methyl ester carboxylesterase